MHPLLKLAAFFAASLAFVAAAEPSGQKPWFDDRLRAFFTLKEKHAHALQQEQGKAVAPEIWTYFGLGKKGEWVAVQEAGDALTKRSVQELGPKADPLVATALWPTIQETDLAYHVMDEWPQKYFDKFAQEIINSIPRGSIYFGGGDAGRGIITVASKSQPDADPFFTLTQNALAETSYQEYLRFSYGKKFKLPDEEQVRNIFADYAADVTKRKSENKLKEGEIVTEDNGQLLVQSAVAIMQVNGLLVKAILDANPEHDFFMEESYELEWAYPFLTPHGLIIRLNHSPLAQIPADAVAKDHEYWTKFVKPLIGDWLREDTSVDALAEYAQKIYSRRDYDKFKGDLISVTNYTSRSNFAHCRSAIGRLYAWRAEHAASPELKLKMTREAEFAYKQAFVLCPNMPDVLYPYLLLLEKEGRLREALYLAVVATHIGGAEQKDTDYLRSLLEYYKALQRDAVKPADKLGRG